MENVLLSFNYQTEYRSENNYLLCFNSKYYQIGKMIYEILKVGKCSQTISELNQQLKDYDITDSELSNIISNRIVPIFLKNQLQKKTGASDIPFMESYWWTGELLNSKMCSILSKPLSILFGKAFIPIFIILSFLNISMYESISYVATPTSLGNDVLQIIIVYILLTLILCLHELGHIAALIKANLSPQGISFGFYLFMPILYVNLTDAWKLSKFMRTKLNLAGITVQLFTNLLFMLFISIYSDPFLSGVAHKLLLTNTFIILLNLIPFLKFDGYWIVSDIASIPNLMKESGSYITRLFVKKSPFHTNHHLQFSNSQKLFLAIYTVFRVIFIIGVICMIIMFIVYSFVKTILFVQYIQYIDMNLDAFIMITKQLLTMVLVFIITRKYTLSFYKYIKMKVVK